MTCRILYILHRICHYRICNYRKSQHTGHTLAQDGTMVHDAKIRRAQFIDKSTDIREMFHFAKPEQKLAAVVKYCGDHYGVMLYNFSDEASGKYFRCWGTLSKLCWDVPRSTHKYFVPNLLSCGYQSIRTTLLARYVNFFRSLLKSKSSEVALVARLAARDRSSTTGINLSMIQQETGLNPWNTKPSVISQALEEREVTVPVNDLWRLPLLKKLLIQREEMEVACSNTNQINSLIDSLCSS